MRVKHLSTTLLQNWPQCPARAWRSYERRLEHGDDNEGTDATRLGTIMHAVMERVHTEIMQGTDVEFVRGNIMSTFLDEWQRGTCVSFESFQFAHERIEDFVLRSIFVRDGEAETIAAELLFVYDVVTGRVFLPENRQQATDFVNIILERGGVPVVSEIDRVDKVAMEGGYGIKIYDYKSNILPFTRYQIENSVQLGVYDLVARALYPDALDVECYYDMVRHGRFPTRFDDLFRSQLEEFLISLHRQIYSTTEPEERLNQYCRWCERRSECQAYQAALRSPLPAVLTELQDTPDGLIQIQREYEELGFKIKLLEERETELQAMLSAKIVEDNNGQPLVLGDKEIYLQPNPRGEYPTSGLWEVLSDQKALILLKDMVNVSKTAVDRMLKKYPHLREHIQPLLQTKFNRPSLKVRKAKKREEDNDTKADSQGDSEPGVS